MASASKGTRGGIYGTGRWGSGNRRFTASVLAVKAPWSRQLAVGLGDVSVREKRSRARVGVQGAAPGEGPR